MDAQQRISVVASSSNSSSMVSSKKYDVFLSFRGEDTRTNFTSHLYEALKQKKVETYIDYWLEKGDEISPTLIKAIKDSHVSVVVFSENYASSKWCLGELSNILECKKEKGHIVIPVFYKIDPSDVRKQTGSYEQAFAKHEGEPECNKWKVALTEAANLAGWDSRNRIESEFLKDIVEDVLQKLAPRYPKQRKGLVGIEKNYKQIESLLEIGSREVKILGIWGMGGIGKTTLATALYDKLSHKFEGHCFISNVRANSDKLEDLRDKLFSKLSGNNNHSFDYFEMSRVQHKNVFIVLDDVATPEQFEKLIEEYDFLGEGSRVIVTTRNKQILSPNYEIYKVEELSFDHSLQLFCLNAFGEKQPKDGYDDLSSEVISYCNGIPLALKVLGASLRSRSKEAWEDELRKLQKMPNMEIHNVLKLSYDGLDHFQQSMFLDIACFFRGETRDYVKSVLKAFDFFPASGLEVLLDKALITISYDNRIEMHDLIQEMGRNIVYQESTKYPGRQSRLWKHEEVRDVLKDNMGTDAVEGIILDLRKLSGDFYLSSYSFAKMTNMRFVKIHRGDWWSSRFNVYLPNGLESLSDKLRYLHWDGFCLESLPSNFYAEQLVELSLPSSNLKMLWDGVQNLMNLKTIDLMNSRYLVELPDLSKAEKLEGLYLDYCKSLRQIHVHAKSLRVLNLLGCSSLNEISVTSEKMERLSLSETAICAMSSSMLCLPKLKYLDLRDCKEIERFNVHLKSLRELHLDGCSSLREFSVTSEEMETLSLSKTAICELSSSMLSLPKLISLDLRECREIESFDVHLKSLYQLHLDGCSSLREFSVTSEEMKSLCLSKTAICALSSSMLSLPKLKYLYLRDCTEIESFDVDLKSLCELHLDGCSSLREFSVTSEEMEWLSLSKTAICALSSSMLYLPKLKYLDLRDCREIESINVQLKSLCQLHLDGCSSLREFSVTSEEMEWLSLSKTAICALSSSMLSLPKLKYLHLRDCREIKSFDVYLKSLCQLDLDGCSSLREFSVTSEEMQWLSLSKTAICALSSSMLSLPKLKYLDLSDCREIESFDVHLKSLCKLDLDGCSSLREFSVTSEEMEWLSLSNTGICALSSSIGHI